MIYIYKFVDLKHHVLVDTRFIAVWISYNSCVGVYTCIRSLGSDMDYVLSYYGYVILWRKLARIVQNSWHQLNYRRSEDWVMVLMMVLNQMISNISNPNKQKFTRLLSSVYYASLFASLVDYYGVRQTCEAPWSTNLSLTANFVGPTPAQRGSCRLHVGPAWVQHALLSGVFTWSPAVHRQRYDSHSYSYARAGEWQDTMVSGGQYHEHFFDHLIIYGQCVAIITTIMMIIVITVFVIIVWCNSTISVEVKATRSDISTHMCWCAECIAL